MEREPYALITAMSEARARAFFGGAFFKVLCLGQALGPRYRFGARTYALFRRYEDWRRYQVRARFVAGPMQTGASREELVAALQTLGLRGIDFSRASESKLWQIARREARICSVFIGNAKGVERE